jgi:hypothetical protein
MLAVDTPDPGANKKRSGVKNLEEEETGSNTWPQAGQGRLQTMSETVTLANCCLAKQGIRGSANSALAYAVL